MRARSNCLCNQTSSGLIADFGFPLHKSLLKKIESSRVVKNKSFCEPLTCQKQVNVAVNRQQNSCIIPRTESSWNELGWAGELSLWGSYKSWYDVFPLGCKLLLVRWIANLKTHSKPHIYIFIWIVTFVFVCFLAIFTRKTLNFSNFVSNWIEICSLIYFLRGKQLLLPFTQNVYNLFCQYYSMKLCNTDWFALTLVCTYFPLLAL